MELRVNSFAYNLFASTPASHFLRPSWVTWIYLDMRGGGSGRCRYQVVETRQTARTAAASSHHRGNSGSPRPPPEC
jgi:hypothetical protein